MLVSASFHSSAINHVQQTEADVTDCNTKDVLNGVAVKLLNATCRV